MKSVVQRFELSQPPIELVRRPIEAIAFWTAITLPFLHVPLLFYGLETTSQLAAYFGLLVLNVVAFVVGHGHKRR